MQVVDRLADKKSRFKIEKLEERIAPSSWCSPRHCKGDDGIRIYVKVDIKLSLFGGGHGKC